MATFFVLGDHPEPLCRDGENGPPHPKKSAFSEFSCVSDSPIGRPVLQAVPIFGDPDSMTHLPAGSLSASDLISSQAESQQNSKMAIRAIRRLFAPGAGSFISAATLSLFCVLSSSGQAPTLAPSWNQQLPVTIPTARFADTLAYDAAHSQVVMFGGFTNGGVVSDTWLWNGTNWTQANPANSPSARSNQTMVYDAAQGQVVMFGGAVTAQGSSRLNDTWLWNGANWTQVTGLSTTPPSAKQRRHGLRCGPRPGCFVRRSRRE